VLLPPLVLNSLVKSFSADERQTDESVQGHGFLSEKLRNWRLPHVITHALKANHGNFVESLEGLALPSAETS